MEMRTFLCIAAFFACLASVQGLFEEQAGVIDWHKENLGRITHAEFAFKGRERLFVGSQAGAIASLDTKDGSIVWRQVLIIVFLSYHYLVEIASMQELMSFIISMT